MPDYLNCTEPFEHENLLCLIAPLAGFPDIECPYEEMMSVLRVSEKRRREFKAGRHLARHAIEVFAGVRDVVLTVREDRLPDWPKGICGSISHSDEFVGVAISSERHYRSIGFDLEMQGAVKEDLYADILLDSEFESVRNGLRDPTAIFSIKEALFKAVFPLGSEYFDFRAVETAESNGSVTAVCLQKLRSKPLIEAGCGRYQSEGSQVISLFLLPH